MIVVDSPIIASTTFQTLATERVLQLHACDPTWEAPIIWRTEFLSVVAFLLSQKTITYQQAEEGIETAAYFIGPREHLVSPYSILSLMNKRGCSPQHGEYLALAEKLSTKLITYNNQILKDFPDLAMKPEDYIAQKK